MFPDEDLKLLQELQKSVCSLQDIIKDKENLNLNLQNQLNDLSIELDKSKSIIREKENELQRLSIIAGTAAQGSQELDFEIERIRKSDLNHKQLLERVEDELKDTRRQKYQMERRVREESLLKERAEEALTKLNSEQSQNQLKVTYY